MGAAHHTGVTASEGRNNMGNSPGEALLMHAKGGEEISTSIDRAIEIVYTIISLICGYFSSLLFNTVRQHLWLSSWRSFGLILPAKPIIPDLLEGVRIR